MSASTLSCIRRHFLQFSLRTLLVLAFSFCVLLAWAARRASLQREAVAWVEQMGGSVTYDYEVDSSLRHLPNATPPVGDWLVGQIGVDFFCRVVSVELPPAPLALTSNLAVEQIDLAPVSMLSSLRQLVVRNENVNDLLPLAELNNLKVLTLDRTPVSDLTPLADLEELADLTLEGTQVTDLSPLTRLSNLSSLRIVHVPVWHAPAWQVGSGSALYLDRAMFGLRGEDRDTQQLPTAKFVTDFSALQDIPSLKVLEIQGTPMDESTLLTLKQSLPQCRIGFRRRR